VESYDMRNLADPLLKGGIIIPLFLWWALVMPGPFVEQTNRSSVVALYSFANRSLVAAGIHGVQYYRQESGLLKAQLLNPANNETLKGCNLQGYRIWPLDSCYRQVARVPPLVETSPSSSSLTEGALVGPPLTSTMWQVPYVLCGSKDRAADTILHTSQGFSIARLQLAHPVYQLTAYDTKRVHLRCFKKREYL
jgi:hypothetical protein